MTDRTFDVVLLPERITKRVRYEGRSLSITF